MSRLLYGANVQANGIRQHYLRYGREGIDQPVMVIIPGITSPAITWGFVAERLGEHFDTYVLDVRGRGLSSTGPELDYDPTTCADDIRAFIETLGLTDVSLMGHSMGARFAVRAITRGLTAVTTAVLVDPPVSGPNRRAYPSKLPWYVDSIQLSLSGMSAEDMLAFCPTWTLEQRQLRAEWLPTCYEPAIVRAFNDFHDDDFHADLPVLSIPTVLMVAGKGGVIAPSDEAEMLELTPDLSIHRVPDAGHMIPWDDFDGFFNALAAAGLIKGE